MTDELLARYEQAQAWEQGAVTNRLVLNDVVLPHWIGDTDYFWYLRETREGKAFRLIDAAAASNEPAFDHQSLADALASAAGQSVDASDLPVVVEDISPSLRQVRFRAFNKTWLFDGKMKCCTPVENTGTNESGASMMPDNHLLSPDGKKVVFVREHNLWLRDVVSGKERALTHDGCDDNAYATAPTILGYPLTPAVQALWSPDSGKLLTHQLDVRQVATRAMIRHVPPDNNTRPQLTRYKVAYPGDETVESYRLLVIDIGNGEQQRVNYASLPVCRFGVGFFTREKLAWWSIDNRRVYFVDVARGAKCVRVVAWDVQNRSTHILFEETSETTVKLSYGFEMGDSPLMLPLPETEELIWFSERSGWGHLYLYDLNTGKLKGALTKGEWLVRGILQLDNERRELLVQTAGRDSSINPYYRDICRVNLDTAALTPLRDGAFEHAVFDSSGFLINIRDMFGIDSRQVSGVSPSGNYLVTTRSRADQVPVSLLIDREGKDVLTLETANPYGSPNDWHWPEPVKVTAADGETSLYGVIYRPSGFSPDKSYPVLDFLCCGHPDMSILQQSSFSSGALFGLPYFRAAAYAALGFVVVTLEGRGTPYRDKAFQDFSSGDINAANAFDDHITGLRQLAERYPYMDLERVGIIAPDSLSGPVYGLLQYPDFYKVGVAIGFQDPRLAPACVSETLEGLHSQRKIPYVEELAASLKGKLLLVHGLLDPLSVPTGFFRLVEALQKANKDVDMLVLPNLGHDLPSYVLRRSWDYLVEHLLDEIPPEEFKLHKALDLLMQAD